MAKKSKPEVADKAVAEVSAPIGSREVASAVPGSEAPEAATGDGDAAKPGRKTKLAFSIPEGGLEAVPVDHDPTIHRPLRAKDFVDVVVYLEMMAAEHTAKAAKFATKATKIRALGSVKKRAKSARLLALLERTAQLEAMLRADIGDEAVDEVLQVLNNPTE